MSEERYREFEPLEKLPADWPNAVAAFLSPISNVNLAAKNANTMKVPVDAQQQLSLGVDGLWRYVSAEVDAVVPAGAAQTYDIVATTTANVFKAPTKEGEGESDETNYSFALQVVKAGTLPSGGGIAGAQKIGEVDWDGAKIIGVRQLVGDLRATDVLTPTQPLVSVSPLTVKGIAGSTAPLVNIQGGNAADPAFAISRTGTVNDLVITAGGAFVWQYGGVTLTATGDALLINEEAIVVTTDARLTNSRPPNGAAGGDLSATYPNPHVSTVLGGQTPVSTTTTIGGDLTGTLPNPTIPAIAPVGSVMSYAGFADPNVRWLLADNRAVSRSTYATLMNLTTQAIICGVTAGSAVLKPATSGLVIPIGAAVEGTGIPAGTTIIAHEGINLVMSRVATATGAAISCVFFPFGNGNGTTTFNIPWVQAGRVIIGSAAGTTGPWPVATRSGEEYVTLTLAQMPEHNHTLTIEDVGHLHEYAGKEGIEFMGRLPSSGSVNAISNLSMSGPESASWLNEPLTGDGWWTATTTAIGKASMFWTEQWRGSSERHPNMQPSTAFNHIVRVL